MRDRVMRPASMEFMFSCYYKSDIHPQYNTACMELAAGELRELGLLKQGCKNTLTEKGFAYCDSLLNHPLPELMWVVNGEIVGKSEESE